MEFAVIKPLDKTIHTLKLDRYLTIHAMGEFIRIEATEKEGL